MHTCTGEIALPPIADLSGWKSRRLVVGAAALFFALGSAVWAGQTERSAARAVTIEHADFGVRGSHNGRYRAAVLETRSAGIGDAQRWTVSVTGSNNEEVERAHLAVRTWMPESGELSPVVATVRDLGGGRYQIDNIALPRAGWWNVALVIEGAAGTDSLAFNVRLR